MTKVIWNRSKKFLYLGVKNLVLPPLTGNRPRPVLPSVRQLTIIGGAGAGKSRFMDELIRLTGNRAYCLSAISAPFPEREESTRPGSIDMLYKEAIKNKPYMTADAVSELDKLTYMLFTDEFEALLSIKEKQKSKGGRTYVAKHTKLDLLAKLWEEVFPGNHIHRSKGKMLFATSSGQDLISTEKLSQGEQTVLYYAAAVLYAMPGAVIFVDSPSLFLHPSELTNLWNSIERLRPDCCFVYNSVDVGFVSSRSNNVCVWIKSYDARSGTWDYDVLHPDEFSEDVFVDLIGSRKPVLFIEGDVAHSIDARLYPLVFPEWNVKPLGSCDKVIETTRTFNGLKTMHHINSRGIVDRDRRTAHEVKYLRQKSIMVPDVAEVENLFLLEGVIRAMAVVRGKNPDTVFSRVKKKVIGEFARLYREQALQHIRYRIKREVEYKIDMRFRNIGALEKHLDELTDILSPRARYNELVETFKSYIRQGDYPSVLRVFNHKPMISESGVATELAYKNKDEYIAGVISLLKGSGTEAENARKCIRNVFFQSETT